MGFFLKLAFGVVGGWVGGWGRGREGREGRGGRRRLGVKPG